ncbi:MAG: hypothetical protein H0T72_03560 [Chloroflexia bacterium]|nr:hypothetical protein [Chloroflexia bacterium]
MIASTAPTPNPSDSLVYREAAADARWSSGDALSAYRDTFVSIADDPEADPFERFNASERLRACTEELDRRARVARLAAGQGKSWDRDRAAWTHLAEIVKERTSVPEVLELAGIAVTRTGRNRRSGANEYHSACPVCRDGIDRLVSWDGPSGRVWCRRCEWSADAIAVCQSVIPGCGEFRDAVRFLADLARMVVNDGR